MAVGNWQVVEVLTWIVIACRLQSVFAQSNLFEYDETYLVTEHGGTHSQYGGRDSQGSWCYDEFRKPLRCIPEFVNAAFKVRVDATNTCGLRGPLEYCLQTGATGAKKSCEICDASNPYLAHPPEYLTDFNNNDNQTWWQSETMYEGIQYPNQVNLTLHLGKAFDITYVRLKFHTSRPESFAIFKRTSEDGPWIPYQYYSATCRDTYGVQDRSYVSKEDETKALCTSEYSDISPLNGGNVAFSTLEGRPSAYDFEHSPILQEWVTATDIRITLDRVNTFGDEIFGDPKVLKSYYYGVSDFAVGGRCKCNGHASECHLSGNQLNPWEPRLVCRCEHNTAGADCNECLPFYNDQPWARSTGTNVHECKEGSENEMTLEKWEVISNSQISFEEFANADIGVLPCELRDIKQIFEEVKNGTEDTDSSEGDCGEFCTLSSFTNFWRARLDIPCNCNNRSNKCYFDEELWQQTGHGGHCIDCIDNTDGANCERCKETFYEREDGRCIPCNCDSVGSRSLQCNNKGQCMCKPGVEGQTCNTCSANFYDFTELGCRPCGCNVAGSIDNTPTCDHMTGVCSCKDNVEGQRCDQCKPGYFDLQAVNEFGCLPCFCFGHSSICRSAPGYSQYSIESSFYRDKERWITKDYNKVDIPSQHNSISEDISVTAPARDVVYFIAPARYLGDQRTSYNQFLQFVFRVGEEGPQATLEDIVLEGALSSISQPIFGQGNPLPTTLFQDYKFRLHEHSAYGWNPRLSSHDFMTILSNLTAIKIKATYTPRGSGFLSNVLLETGHRSSTGLDATWVEMCTCPEGYVGQFCESCAPGYRHDPPSGGRFSRCIPCNCHGHAELCDTDTGRCICKPSTFTAGDNCELCASGYYGNALLETPDACQPCPCPNHGACVILPDDTVACLVCPEGYAGHKCNLCVDGYYGAVVEEYDQAHCQKCECSDNVDPNAVGNCDRATGECLKCVHNTGGEHCESCLPGYHGDALKVPKGDCKACNCYHIGTTITHPEENLLVCDYGSGQCPCKPNVKGLQCDVCEAGFWNIQSGHGCEACNCDPTGATDYACDIHTGQCSCRTGVTGQHCDQCLPHHYGFSNEGCKMCECDPIGSLSLQCSPLGQCECRPNVEGRRCERCKENTYNKAAGCVDCPPCYNLVKDAADLHRNKMAELAELLNAIQENPHLVDDDEFLEKLREVQDRVDALLDDAKSSSGFDENVGEKLKELHKRLLDIQKSVGVISMKLEEAKQIGDLGVGNITIAEDVIKRAQEALASARKYLETDGIKALEKAIERSEKFGRQSERMSQIARESRNLADIHEEEANEIETIAFEAQNTSLEAYKKAEDALKRQSETSNEIYRLERSLSDAENMLKEVKQIAKDAKTNADKVYDDVLDLYTDANSIVLPDVDADAMKNNASYIIDEAQKIQARVDDLMEAHSELLGLVAKQQDDAEELLLAGEKQQQITEEMLAETDAALQKAREAVATGEQILEDAKQTLETLKGFDQLVQESKERALEALDKVPIIEELIEDAENKTDEAKDALRDADFDAKKARDIAQEAQKVAEQASKNANAVLDEAEETKDKADKLREQADDLVGQTEDTADRMKEYEDQAESDETLAKEALERANQAKTSATDASVKVKNALDTVEDILRALDGLDEIDTKLLLELEKRLDEAEKELKEANFEPRMTELRQARELQNQWMRDYSEEVARLEKEVENIAAISAALPDECYRRLVLEP